MKETKEMYPSWSNDHDVRLGNVRIKDLHDFKEHPFHVVEDTALFELAKSIEDKGLCLTEIRYRDLTKLLTRQSEKGLGFVYFQIIR